MVYAGPISCGAKVSRVVDGVEVVAMSSQVSSPGPSFLRSRRDVPCHGTPCTRSRRSIPCSQGIGILSFIPSWRRNVTPPTPYALVRVGRGSRSIGLGEINFLQKEHRLFLRTSFSTFSANKIHNGILVYHPGQFFRVPVSQSNASVGFRFAHLGGIRRSMDSIARNR
jgi:hypothetical protein